MYLSFTEEGTQAVSQCMPVSPNTTYDTGMRLRVGSARASCLLHLYPGADCQGNGVEAGSYFWLNVGEWSPDLPFSIDTEQYTSARISCAYYVEAGGFWIDKVFLAKAPGSY